MTSHKRPSLRRMRRHPRDDSTVSPSPFPPAQGPATPCPMARMRGPPAAAEDGERTLPAGPARPASPQPNTPAQHLPPLVCWDEESDLWLEDNPTAPPMPTPTR